MTTVKLTEELTTHLRTLLFEDMHERAQYLAKAAHSAHEGRARPQGKMRTAAGQAPGCRNRPRCWT